MDFELAYQVFLSPMTFSNYLRFPLSTNDVYAFNKDISTDLFGYVEEESMGSEYKYGMFTNDLPSKQALMEQYWHSKLLLSDYLDEKPYANAEFLVFNNIPAHLLEGFINNQKAGE
ncbi:hypothetical protein [Salicibibacter cibarius]|nr:hypothetical protein [Salicibibacter cibarius]